MPLLAATPLVVLFIFPFMPLCVIKLLAAAPLVVLFIFPFMPLCVIKLLAASPLVVGPSSDRVDVGVVLLRRTAPAFGTSRLASLAAPRYLDG